jgi:putative phage-type endonuclease
MIEQRTPEWFEARKGRVTGSVVGGILGISPYMTRADVLRSMVRASLGAPSEFTGNVATEWGTYNEAGAIQEFEMETSERVSPMPFVEYEDWLGASPDGVVTDGKGLEVKCPYGIRNDPNPIFKMPQELPHYMAQCQVEMFCADWQSLWFYQWTPHGTCNKLIHRDDDWLATNIPRLKQFHAEYLWELENNPEEHLTEKRITIDTPEAAKMVQEFDQLTEALERAGERRKDLLAEMVAMSGDRNAVFGGRKLTLTKKAGAVSYASVVKKLCPNADLEPYRGKPSSFWGLK